MSRTQQEFGTNTTSFESTSIEEIDNFEITGLQSVDSSDYTLSLQSVFRNDLISEFEFEWILQFNFAELDLANIEGIIPKKYKPDSEDNDSLYYIYGLSTSDEIDRPSFEILEAVGIESILQTSYSSKEISSLKAVYEKQELSDSIRGLVSNISANIFAKMNLNIEQNLNFQKSKVKKIGFANISVFEKQPEVILKQTEDSIAVITPVFQGGY